MICTSLILPLALPLAVVIIRQLPPLYNILHRLLDNYLVWGLTIHLLLALYQHGLAIIFAICNNLIITAWSFDLMALLIVASVKLDEYAMQSTEIEALVGSYDAMKRVMTLLPNVAVFKVFNSSDNATNSHIGSTTNWSLMILMSISQVVLWLPIVYNWSFNHCLLDGFIDSSNSATSYVTTLVALSYFKMLFIMFQTSTQPRSYYKLLFISVVAFYNITWGSILMLCTM